MNHFKSFTLAFAAALIAAPTVAAGAQDTAVADAQDQFAVSAADARAPRFLIAESSRNARPTPLDVRRTPVLMRRISVQLDGVPLKQALADISTRSGLTLVYGDGVLPPEKRVHLRAELITVVAALTDVLADVGVDVVFNPQGGAVIVRRTSAVEQAAGTVFGTVTDSATGEPVANAIVSVKGTAIRAATSDRGQYQLRDVPSGPQVIMTRLIGYLPREKEVTVADDRTVRADFALRHSPTRLQEVVLTATGPRRRYELGNDITVLNADSIVRTQPVTNLTELLTNRVPGLSVQRATGAPGDPSRLRLRGVGSALRSNDPIVIVDGVRIYSNSDRNENTAGGNISTTPAPSPLDQIDVNSIETVEVLKGPSAATLYGPDAANGVVVVTTKKGRAGPPRWTASVEQGRSEIPGSYPNSYFGLGRVPFTSTPTFCIRTDRARPCALDQVVSYQLLNDPRFTPLGQGDRMGVTVGVSGGASALGYALTASASDETGILKLPAVAAEEFQERTGGAPPSWMRRPQQLKSWAASSRLTAQVGRSADVSVTSQLAHGMQQRSSMETELGFLMATYVDPQTGAYLWSHPGAQRVEFPQLMQEYYRRTTSAATTLTTGAALNWRPRTWATVSANVGFSSVDREDESLFPRSLTRSPLSNLSDTLGTLGVGNLSSLMKTANVQGMVRLPLARGFLFQTAAGANYTGSNTHDIWVSSYNLPEGSDALGANTSVRQGGSDAAVFGWYVEPTLSHKRLFLSTGIRLDGGNTYGASVKLFRLPKLSLSWLASDEPFFPDILAGVFNTLRLRIAYGQAGTQPGITDRLRLYRDRSDEVYGTLRELTSLGNTQIRPERSTEIEGGFDADMLDNRITVELTGYRKVRRDAIVSKLLPPSVAGSIGNTTLQNVGEILNTGLELGFGVSPVRSELATWSMRVNVSRNTNLVVSLGEGVAPFSHGSPGSFTRVVEGYPLFGMWGRPILGYADANGNGVLEQSEVTIGDTNVFLGATTPNYGANIHTTFGLLNNALTLDAGFAYVDGVTQTSRLFSAGAFTRGAVDPEAPFAEQAPAVSGNEAAFSQTVSTLRLNTVSLAYRIPAVVTRLFRATGMSIALQGTNLGLWTDYPGKDPDVGADPTSSALLDLGQLPQPRTWRLRVNVAY